MATTTTKATQLRVTLLKLHQVLGAESVTVEPGRVTIVSGPNGSGKSTVLQGLQAGLGGGSLANLARIDGQKGKAEDPEIVLVLQGPGHEEYRIKKNAKGVAVQRRIDDSAAFEKLPQPQAWLDSLRDPVGCNPVRFLTAADKDRALLLLEALDLKYDRAELLAAMDLPDAVAENLPPVPRGLHPLEEVALTREGVFRARTGINVSARQKREAGEELRKKAPAVVPGDPVAAIAELDAATRAEGAAIAQAEEAAAAAEREASSAARAKHGVGEQDLRNTFKVWRAERQAAHEAKAAEIREEAERRIRKLAGELETEIDGRATADERALDELDRQRDEALAAAAAARAEATPALQARREALDAEKARLADLRAQSDSAKAAALLHKQAAEFDGQADTLEADAQRLTAALDALDAYRRRMAEELPIPGLEIVGKEIRVNGVPFDQLNTAQRVGIAVEVAALRAKGQRLPLLFVDGAEALDTAHFEALVQELSRRDVQAVVARVTDGPFTVSAA